MERLNRDDAAMLTAFTWALCAPCCLVKAGCVITNGTVISVGYNGNPSGTPNCTDANEGCKKSRKQKCAALHAEDNALIFAKRDPRLAGATMYVTIQPCVSCSSKIISHGISHVIAAMPYSRVSFGNDGRFDESQQAEEWLARAGVKFSWYEPIHPFAKTAQELYLREIEQYLAQFRPDEP